MSGCLSRQVFNLGYLGFMRVVEPRHALIIRARVSRGVMYCLLGLRSRTRQSKHLLASVSVIVGSTLATAYGLM